MTSLKLYRQPLLFLKGKIQKGVSVSIYETDLTGLSGLGITNKKLGVDQNRCFQYEEFGPSPILESL
jgi:hypothetical protein